MQLERKLSPPSLRIHVNRGLRRPNVQVVEEVAIVDGRLHFAIADLGG